MKLPDEFQMRTYGFPGFTHTVKRNGWGDYEVCWARGFDRISYSMSGTIPGKLFSEETVAKLVKGCEWFIVDAVKTLTAEQQRQLNDLKERVAQLDNSIRLNEQSIEHYKRLIGNYEATKADLLKKIEGMV
jgi:hypothetical protein